jgi:hypothetical protein
MMASEDVPLDPDQMAGLECSGVLSSEQRDDADVHLGAVEVPDGDNMEVVSLDGEKIAEVNVDEKGSNLGTNTEELFTQRDTLLTELEEKKIQIDAFETELARLKGKVEALETEKGQILAEHEKLHLQNESLNVKVNEVTTL